MKRFTNNSFFFLHFSIFLKLLLYFSKYTILRVFGCGAQSVHEGFLLLKPKLYLPSAYPSHSLLPTIIISPSQPDFQPIFHYFSEASFHVIGRWTFPVSTSLRLSLTRELKVAPTCEDCLFWQRLSSSATCGWLLFQRIVQVKLSLFPSPFSLSMRLKMKISPFSFPHTVI